MINAVTLETMAQIPEILKQFPEYDNLEVVQVNIAKGRELGAYHLMMAQNPVCIISFGGGEQMKEKMPRILLRLQRAEAGKQCLPAG